MNTPASNAEIEGALSAATDALLRERCDAGHWVGELCSSALSTATAVIALTRLSPGAEQSADGKDVAGGIAVGQAGNRKAQGTKDEAQLDGIGQ